MAKATTDKDDGSLKRLGGGRWQTRDERFTIEPQSGTWVVVDSEQTDDLGLPLVRGPFGSLTAAKEAIAKARGAEPAVSPLAAQLAELRERRAAEPKVKASPKSKAKAKPAEPEPPPEPAWLRDLEPDQRRHADELIDRLTKAGAADAEGIAQREVAGKIPAVAAYAIARSLVALGPQATPAEVASLLAAGRDTGLGVRWRLVDDDGRPIVLDLAALTPH
jgi:hypothetical protein